MEEAGEGGRGGCEASEPFCCATAEGSRELLWASSGFWVHPPLLGLPRAANPKNLLAWERRMLFKTTFHITALFTAQIVREY